MLSDIPQESSRRVWHARRAGSGVTFPSGEDFHLEPGTREARVALRELFKYDLGTLDAPPEYAFFRYSENPEAPRWLLGHFFKLIGGIPVVSGDLRRLMESFELGATKFYPLPLYEHDKTTRRTEELYVLHVDEVKDTFDLENSSGVEHIGTSNFYGASNLSNVALKGSACEGADLWREAHVRYVWFFSDRLKQALEHSGLLDRKYPRLNFIPCKVQV